MKDVSSHEMKCYLQCRRQILSVRSLQQVMLELQCTESLVWASKNTTCCVSAKKQMKRMQAHICWKALSPWEKLFMQF